MCCSFSYIFFSFVFSSPIAILNFNKWKRKIKSFSFVKINLLQHKHVYKGYKSKINQLLCTFIGLANKDLKIPTVENCCIVERMCICVKSEKTFSKCNIFIIIGGRVETTSSTIKNTTVIRSSRLTPLNNYNTIYFTKHVCTNCETHKKL